MVSSPSTAPPLHALVRRLRLRTDCVRNGERRAEGPVDRGVCRKCLRDVAIESNEIGTPTITLYVLAADAASEVREIVLRTQFVGLLLTLALHTISARGELPVWR